jgi:hypothetical protein
LGLRGFGFVEAFGGFVLALGSYAVALLLSSS